MSQWFKQLLLDRDSRRIKSSIIGFLLGVLAAAGASSFAMYCMYRAYAADSDTGWLFALMLVTLIWLAFFLAIPVLAVLIFVKKLRCFVVPALFFCLVAVAGFWISPKGDNYRIRAMESIAQTGEQIINAIKSFENKYGHPPEKLTDLVPEFLNEIPSTGIKACPSFLYETGVDTEKVYHGNSWVLLVIPPLVDEMALFLYYPNGEYPLDAQEGKWELIDGWAYVHGYLND